MIITEDGSYTLYSQEFKQHYHNRKDGAFKESLYKHIIPSFELHQTKKELYILDICFGLGYNTLLTLYYIKQQNLDIKVKIFSPEFDKQLIKSLKEFIYPKELEEFKYIINQLSQTLSYKDDTISIEIYQGDAREYLDILKTQNIKFDIIYQDAFSSDVNRQLWSVEYFKQIQNLSYEDTTITTYSVATPVRLSMFFNNFNIYEYKPKDINKLTIATNKKLNTTKYKFIDMELKQQRNKEAKAIYDE